MKKIYLTSLSKGINDTVRRIAMLLLVICMLPINNLWAQNMNEKFSMTTQMLLNELKTKSEQSTGSSRRASAPHRPDGMRKMKQHRLIASPDTVAGVAYIPCFIHLQDVDNLNAVRSLGVEIEETFDGLDFVTARVPVNQLEKLAEIDNVKRIKVARQMRPLTDEARRQTHVSDLLTQSPDALAAGASDLYDGTGVVLGIIDTGIDFQHVAFKDKNGKSRIKRAYVYKNSGTEYSKISNTTPSTDDNTEDHGTHTATTAGGSSVIVNGNNVTVTDDHANATFGGMAPGADLYLAGIKSLDDTGITNALKKMIDYADSQNQPLVVSNSWGSGWGPRDGTGELALLVSNFFGDSHPNHIILFASSNDAGKCPANQNGGFFVEKKDASSSNPLGAIIQTEGELGNYYVGLLACAWTTAKANCVLYVLNNETGAVEKSWKVTNSKESFSGLSKYYDGSLAIYIEQDNGQYQVAVYTEEGLESNSEDEYTLAIEVYPASGTADVKMWGGDWSYFTDHLTTDSHTWTAGTDDMCVTDEATIPDAIAVGAYVSKDHQKNYQGTNYDYSSGTLGDIAYFSSYATAKLSPTGQAYPWITAPGAQLVAGVNHYHKSSDEYSYYNPASASELVVNSTTSPYAVMQGTSMATPVAAGIVALWMQAAQSIGMDLTVNDVKNIMAQTAIKDEFTDGINASHFGNGKIDALGGIQYILKSVNSPVVRATPKNIDFGNKNNLNDQQTKTLTVKGMKLEGDVTISLADANGVYTIDKTTLTKDEAEAGATVTVTFLSATAGTFDATITLSSSGAADVVVSLTATAKESTVSTDTNNFKLVATTNDLESGMRYIIACGSKATAAGEVSGVIITPENVTVDDDIITISEGVSVFVVEGDQSSGWTFKNEKTNKYLYATEVKKLAYSDEAKTWTLGNGTDGVIMTYGSFGTILYNVNSPRFTTYTSNPSASMIQANLYMENGGGTTPPVNTKDDVTMAFSATSASVTLGEEFVEPALTTTPDNLAVGYSSSTPSVASVDETTGEVTPVSAGTTVITATFAGDDSYNPGTASYTLTVNASTTPIDPGQPAAGTGIYALVTDDSTLKIGDHILIAYINEGIVCLLGVEQRTNNRAATEDVTINVDGTITPGSEAQVITLEWDGTNYLFNAGNGYLYAASSTKNWLRTEETADDNAKATININADSEAIILFRGSNTRNQIRFNPNNGTPIFSSYAESSTTGKLPQIYLETASPATGIVHHDAQGVMSNEAGEWYSIDGRRLFGKPTMKGLYIRGGHKVVIK